MFIPSFSPFHSIQRNVPPRFTFSTANVYSAGQSEIVLGKAIKEMGVPRESVVILTKVYFPVGDELGGRSEALKVGRGFVNESGLSRKVRLRLSDVVFVKSWVN